MSDSPTWKGHDAHRDLPMLGIDPDAPWDFQPVDDGRRPDNSDPEKIGESIARLKSEGMSTLQAADVATAK